MSVSKIAIDRFTQRQAPTLLRARYGGYSDQVNEAGEIVPRVKGLTQRAQALKLIATNAMSACTSVGKNILAVHADRSIDDATRTVRASALARKAIEQTKAAFDREGEAGLAEHKELAARLAKTWEPPSNPGQAALDGELRALLKGMKESERIAAVQSDPAMAAAAARGHHLLSGLSPDFHKQIRHQHAERLEPELTAQVDDLKEAIYAANEALASLSEDLGSITDQQSAASLERYSTTHLV